MNNSIFMFWVHIRQHINFFVGSCLWANQGCQLREDWVIIDYKKKLCANKIVATYDDASRTCICNSPGIMMEHFNTIAGSLFWLLKINTT